MALPFAFPPDAIGAGIISHFFGRAAHQMSHGKPIRTIHTN